MRETAFSIKAVFKTDKKTTVEQQKQTLANFSIKLSSLPEEKN